MRFPFFTPKAEKKLAIGPVISEKASSKAASGSHLSAFDNRIPPRIQFKERENFYLSIGRVQNVTESMVLDIINREWYYDVGKNDPDMKINEDAVELMERWEQKIGMAGLFSKMVRNWILNGVHIISPKDWVPLQLQSITGKSRDQYGKTTHYWQQIHGVEKKIESKDFLELPYIELDREAWPTGMFDALMNADWLDIDGRDPVPALSLYRQALQDNMKIHHKYASPRVIYTFPEATEEQINNDLTPMIEGMAPGDRVVLNAEGQITQETVDGNARFIEHVNKIIDEVESGLGSSKNRLITEPSAMADAREAGAQDDDRIMGIMERIKMFMDKEVIPRITGLEVGVVEFKWGSKDSFTLELPEAIEKAINLNIIKPAQALVMLMENHRWKVPTMDEVSETLGIPIEELEPPEAKPDEKEPTQKKPAKEEEQFIPVRNEALEQVQVQSIKLENKLKNEKIVFTTELNRKLKEIK